MPIASKSTGIICLSNHDDAHIPFVQKHLNNQMITVYGLGTAEQNTLSYDYNHGKTVVTYDRKTIDHVKSVWLRKPQIQPEQIHVPAGFERYALSSIRTHSEAILSLFSDAFWISDYFAVLRADSKPYQLSLAHKLGFQIPDTLATSDAQAAKSFLDRYDAIVVKGQMTRLPVRGPDVLDFPTTIVHKGEPVKLQGLHLAPAIFQQAIDADIELRIIVVGDKVYAGCIRDRQTKEMPANVRDWRMNYVRGGAKFEPYSLTRSVAEKCVRLVKEMHLRFGAIDIIVDKKGRLWFLEINPNGQWAFIEEDTGLPIGRAIARLLEAGA